MDFLRPVGGADARRRGRARGVAGGARRAAPAGRRDLRLDRVGPSGWCSRRARCCASVAATAAPARRLRAAGCSRSRRRTSRGCRWSAARWSRGTEPVLLDEHASFARRPRERRAAFVSLVPTQLHRLLDDADGRGRAARASHTVLLGGGPVDPALRARAAAAGRPRGRDVRLGGDRAAAASTTACRSTASALAIGRRRADPDRRADAVRRLRRTTRR